MSPLSLDTSIHYLIVLLMSKLTFKTEIIHPTKDFSTSTPMFHNMCNFTSFTITSKHL